MPTLGFATGFFVGFGSGFVSREVVNYGGKYLRPVARSIVKTGVLTFEKSREAAARIGETFDDVVAEAQAELEEQPNGSAEKRIQKAKKTHTPVKEAHPEPVRAAKGAT